MINSNQDENSIVAQAIRLPSVVDRERFLEDICGSNTVLKQSLSRLIQERLEENVSNRSAINYSKSTLTDMVRDQDRPEDSRIESSENKENVLKNLNTQLEEISDISASAHILVQAIPAKTSLSVSDFSSLSSTRIEVSREEVVQKSAKKEKIEFRSTSTISISDLSISEELTEKKESNLTIQGDDSCENREVDPMIELDSINKSERKNSEGDREKDKNGTRSSTKIYKDHNEYSAPTICLPGSNQTGDHLSERMNSSSTINHNNEPIGPSEVSFAKQMISTAIGPYQIQKVLGEGGMGVVFLAEQKEPIERMVALKVIKPGLDSERIITRFQLERQILAILDHPHIAKVIDGGTTSFGSPYFVMEYVRGIPLTYYADNEKLTIRDRLVLFQKICDAVQHAHQKGIIHRDLKPSNILVFEREGIPEPKVIDFGIAKSDKIENNKKTEKTHFGVIGTLDYMSPEQTDSDEQDVDTRTDVYSLGCILYELLVGVTPFNSQGKKLVEIIAIIQNNEPLKPSVRLKNLTENAAVIAELRQIDIAKLLYELRGDLDWIVMRSLEKDRNRRYPTANGLLRDIDRYLANEPIEARPPTRSYRLQKFYKKNRFAIVFALCFIILLASSTLISISLAIIANKARIQATEAKAQEEKLRKEAESQKNAAHEAEGLAKASEKNAKEEEKKAKEASKNMQLILSFFQLEVLSAIRPEGQEGGLGRKVTIHQALDHAEPKIDRLFGEAPIVEASIREVLGKSYHLLGEELKALKQHQRSFELYKSIFGEDHLTTIASMQNYANSLRNSGNGEKALILNQKTLEVLQKKFGENNADTLKAMDQYGLALQATKKMSEAMRLWKKTLDLQQKLLGPDHFDTIHTMIHLANAYRLIGNDQQALKLFEIAIQKIQKQLTEDHPDQLNWMNQYALAMLQAKQIDRSIAIWEKTVQKEEAILGRKHPKTMMAINNLALGYLEIKEFSKAIPLLKENLELRELSQGKFHPYTLDSLNNLAIAYEKKGDLTQTIQLLSLLVERYTERWGKNDPDRFHAMNHLAKSLLQKKEYSLAESRLLELMEEEKADNYSIERAETSHILIDLFMQTKQFSKAIPILQEVIRNSEKSSLPYREVVFDQMNLSRCYIETNDFTQAEKLLRYALASTSAKLLPFSVLSNLNHSLANILIKENKMKEAESFLLKSYQLINEQKEKTPPEDAQRLQEIRKEIIEFYRSQRNDAKIQEWEHKR